MLINLNTQEFCFIYFSQCLISKGKGKKIYQVSSASIKTNMTSFLNII